MGRLGLGIGLGHGEQATKIVPPVNSPLDIPDLSEWQRSDLGITLDRGFLIGWADQSGNGNHFSKSTISQAPTYATPPGQYPYVSFDETEEQWIGGALLSVIFGSSPLSLFIVCDATGTDKDGVCGSPQQANGLWLLSDSAYYNTGSIAFPRNSSLAIRSVHHNGARFYYCENGIEQASVDVSLAALAGVFRIGLYNGGFPENFISSKFYEIITYARDITIDETVGLIKYLNLRYSL